MMQAKQLPIILINTDELKVVFDNNNRTYKVVVKDSSKVVVFNIDLGGSGDKDEKSNSDVCAVDSTDGS